MRRISRIWIAALLVSGWSPPAAAEPRAVEAWGRRPLAFGENRGQTDGQVKFLSRGNGYTLFLTATEAVLALREGDSTRALRLRWVGSNPSPRVSGEEELPGRSHYLLGSDPAAWRTGISHHGKVRYQEVYPGIDLVFYGHQGQLEHDFVLAPGADPGTVRMAVEGAERAEIDPAGDLVLHLRGGEVRLRRPVAYQDVEGRRREVGSRYRLLRPDREIQVAFELAAHDPARPLVIDPVLAYSTYLGNGNGEIANGIDVDAEGNAYVAGWTAAADFPTTGGPPFQGSSDVFVTKLDPDGALVYSTFLGGSRNESATGIAVDASGHAYATGHTDSSDFPRVNPIPGPGPPVSPHTSNAFVFKLDASGAGLVYATLFGGSGGDAPKAIAVDPGGRAYVGGLTDSPDFPLVRPFAASMRSFTDAFVSKLSASGSELLYSTYLGGSSYDEVRGIAVDAAGHAYVAGLTSSFDFPTRNAFQSSARGIGQAFVTRLHPSGSSLVYSTYLGGSESTQAFALAVDAAGHAYVAGYTFAVDFPTVNPFQGSRKGADDVFVAKLHPSGSSLVYSTYLGGSYSEVAYGIAVDGAGGAYVTGLTSSQDFPLQDAVQTRCAPEIWNPGQCQEDAFVTRLGPDGSRLVYSTFLGGTRFPGPEGEGDAWDGGQAIAVGPQGDAHVAGYTYAADFPTVNAFQPGFGGLVDVFVAKLAENRPPDCAAAVARPDRLWPPNGKLRPVAIRGVTDPDGDSISLTVTSIRQDEPLSKEGSPDATGVGTATPQVRADRAGGGDGRVYHLGFTASDGRGGTCTGEVAVCVPHDQRGRTCGDGGALIDSAGPGS